MLFIESYIKDEVLKDSNISLLEATFDNMDALLEDGETYEFLNESKGGFSRAILKLKSYLLKTSQSILVYAIKIKEKMRNYLNKVFINKKTARKSIEDLVAEKYGSDNKFDSGKEKGKITINLHIPSQFYNNRSIIPKILEQFKTGYSSSARSNVDSILANSNGEDLVKKGTLLEVDQMDKFLDEMKDLSKDIHLLTLRFFKTIGSEGVQTSGTIDPDKMKDLPYIDFEDSAKNINSLLKLSTFITKGLVATLTNFNQDIRVS